ncbi:hypothetical protein J6590_065224 [Homalodisca vitripennis]|nr:hypothetical protein J6590_065224 [Homalodisca vitripennis]
MLLHFRSHYYSLLWRLSCKRSFERKVKEKSWTIGDTQPPVPSSALLITGLNPSHDHNATITSAISSVVHVATKCSNDAIRKLLHTEYYGILVLRYLNHAQGPKIEEGGVVVSVEARVQA